MPHICCLPQTVGFRLRQMKFFKTKVDQFWELESIGKDDKESDSVHDEFKRSLILENGWYTAKLPF